MADTSTAAHHNRVIKAGIKRAEELEPRLVDILQPILEKAGKTAAANFRKHVTDHLTASLVQRDRELMAELGPLRLREMFPSLVLTAAAADVTSNSTMVAVKPLPEEAAKLAAIDGVDPDEIHVTLAYLGEYDGDLDALAAALADVAGSHAPLTGRVGGIGSFDDNGNGYPAIYLPSVPGLVELRVAVTQALVDGGYDYGRDHGYLPHLTISYEDSDMTFPSRSELGQDLHFDDIWVVRGDTETRQLPLAGRKPLTAAAESAAEAAMSLGEAMAQHQEAQAALDRAQALDDAKAIRIAAKKEADAKALVDRKLQDASKDVPIVEPPPESTAQSSVIPKVSAPAQKAAEHVLDKTKEIVDEQTKAAATKSTIVRHLTDELSKDQPAVGIVERVAVRAGVETGLVVSTAEEVGLLTAVQQAEAAAAGGAARALQQATWTAPSPSEVVDVQALAKTLRGKTDPVRQAVIQSVMTPSLDAVGVGFDVSNPFASKVLSQSASQIVNIAETTQLNVMRIIKEAHQQGFSIPETAKAIQTGMAEASVERATLIARTELVGAVNGGSLAATQIVQDVTKVGYDKVWLTAPGAKYPRHEDYEGLDNQKTVLDGFFDVGGEQLQFPGDPNGSPEEVCNCRCTMVYEENGQDLSGDTLPVDVGSPIPADMGAKTDGGLSNVVDAGTPEALVPEVDTISVGTGPPVNTETLARIRELNLDQWPLEQGTVAKTILGGKEDTRALYRHADGTWDPQREQLHREIVAAHFEGKVPGDVADRTAFFTAGGGVSGKGAALFNVGGKEMSLKELEARPDVVTVDPDRIKFMLPEYARIRDAGDYTAASVVHEESSDIAKAVTAEAQKRGFSTVVDTTGSSRMFETKLTAAHDAGYQVKVTMFSTPTNEAIERSIARGDRSESRRYVSIEPLKKAHSGASEQLASWSTSPNVDEWRLYDNTTAAPELVAKGGHGETTVLDDQKWQEILAKKNELPNMGDTTVGVTAFRPEDTAVGFYDTEKARQFEADLAPTAEKYGVTITNVAKAPGIWLGVPEPSWSVRAHDGVEGVKNFAEELRSKYNQDGVMLFAPNTEGDAVEFAISGISSPESVLPDLLGEFGIEGANVTDGKLVVVGSDGDMPKIAALMKARGGTLSARRGSLSFASRPEGGG